MIRCINVFDKISSPNKFLILLHKVDFCTAKHEKNAKIKIEKLILLSIF